MEALWLGLPSLLLEKSGWLSRLETRERKASTSGQRLSYLNCNPAFGLGTAGADLDVLIFYLKIFPLFYLNSPYSSCTQILI